MRIQIWIVIVSAWAIATAAGCAQQREVNQTPQASDAPAKPSQPRFIYFIHPVREGFIEHPTEEEIKGVSEHFLYLKNLTAKGTVLFAGPSTEPPYTGIILFNAPDREAAHVIMNNDPAVKAGVFRARCSPIEFSLVGEFDPTPM